MKQSKFSEERKRPQPNIQNALLPGGRSLSSLQISNIFCTLAASVFFLSISTASNCAQSWSILVSPTAELPTLPMFYIGTGL